MSSSTTISSTGHGTCSAPISSALLRYRYQYRWSNAAGNRKFRQHRRGNTHKTKRFSGLMHACASAFNSRSTVHSLPRLANCLNSSPRQNPPAQSTHPVQGIGLGQRTDFTARYSCRFNHTLRVSVIASPVKWLITSTCSYPVQSRPPAHRCVK